MNVFLRECCGQLGNTNLMGREVVILLKEYAVNAVVFNQLIMQLRLCKASVR